MAPITTFLNEPAQVRVGDDTYKSDGFNATEGNGAWTKKQSSIHFCLASKNPDIQSWNLTRRGAALPHRPVSLRVNGFPVGTIVAVGSITQTFRLDANRIVLNGVDTFQFDVPNAGPVGADPRELGFLFYGLTIRRTNSLLPAVVTPADDAIESSGFNPTDGDDAFTTKRGSIRFHLEGANPHNEPWILVVSGTVLPSRPVNVSMNGIVVGMIGSTGRNSQSFHLDAGRVVANGFNTIRFDVPNAGPVGADPRELGFLLDHFTLDHDGSTTQSPKASERWFAPSPVKLRHLCRRTN